MLKKAVSKAAASEEVRRTLWYVEPLSDARTSLANFFSILLAWNTERTPGVEVELSPNISGMALIVFSAVRLEELNRAHLRISV
jgi:hypothetical protein